MKRLLPILCVLMAVMILVIGMTSISYSWFEPDVKEGIGLEFKDTTKLRSEECSIATFSGTLGNSLVSYSTTALTSGNVTVSEGNTVYYKTVITNASADYDSVVSLFLPSFPVGADNSASIGVAYPTNSFRTFTAAVTDIHIVRNAYVPAYVETDANPGQISVEWFVRCDKGSVTFNPGAVFLMYS